MKNKTNWSATLMMLFGLAIGIVGLSFVEDGGLLNSPLWLAPILVFGAILISLAVIMFHNNIRLWIMIPFMIMAVPAFSQVSPEDLSAVELIMGNLTLAMLKAGYFFAGAGIFLRWGYTTIRGVRSKRNTTPKKFSIVYWFRDNIAIKLLSVMVNFVGIFILFRFTEEYLHQVFSMSLAFIVGLSLDYAMDYLMQLKLNVKK